MTSKERYLAAVRGEPRDRTPVTPIFMAWAAHYVGHTYKEYYLDGDVLVAAQLAMARDFGVDQVSAISDPWRESAAYGMEFTYPDEGVGVPAGPLLTCGEDVAALGPLDLDACERTRQRIESVGKLAEAAGDTHSVLGWVEGPIAQYGDLRGVEQTMMDLIDEPQRFHRAAEVITANALEFARRQVDAGAETVGVGDAAASLLGPALYRQHVLPWETRLFEGIHDAGGLVKLHICGNINGILADVVTAGADVIDLDWMVPVDASRRIAGPDVCLAGNFDPSGVLLQAAPDDVADAARACLAAGGDRFILQPGCEVPPGTSESNIQAFCPGEQSPIADELRR